MNKYELHEYHKQHTQQMKGSVLSKMLPIFVWRNEFIGNYQFQSTPIIKKKKEFWRDGSNEKKV